MASGYGLPQWPSSDGIEPPSTPDRRYAEPPSTTPMGPPPSASKSLFFGGSQNQSRNSPSNSRSVGLFGAAPAARRSMFAGGQGFGSPLGRNQARIDDDEQMMDEDENPESLVQISPGIPMLAASLIGGRPDESMRGTKRPRSNANLSNEKAKADINAYAKGIAASHPNPTLEETDDFLLGTEDILEVLEAEDVDRKNEVEAQGAASQASRELLRFWKDQYPLSREAIEAQPLTAGSEAPDSAIASLLASLLLPLHHPNAWETTSTSQSRKLNRLSGHSGAKTVPEVLFNWLWANHEPGADIVHNTMNNQQGYAAAPEYWDAVLSSTLRGRLDRVWTMLHDVDFRSNNPGYTTPQLDYVEEAIDLMLNLLEQCPARTADDWDVKGASWGVFRRQILRTQDELRVLLEGKEGETENIDKSELNFPLSRSSRRVESCLPQDVYEVLIDICDILRGDQGVIFNSCYDWIEGVITLTAWWDGEEEEDMTGSTRQRRSRQTRAVDLTPTLAYRQRLASSFRAILSEEDLATNIDFSDPIQVATCCIFDGDLEGLVHVLQTYSLTVTSAVVQIAKIGGWLSESALDSRTFRGLDQSDLMVLSYADGPKTSMKDEVLTLYVQALGNRDQFIEAEDNRVIEGWELALMVLSRFDNPYLAAQKVSELLKKIPLASPEKVNKLLELCNGYGFSEQALQIAEKFGDDLVGSRSSYGEALIYYAKSHNTQKMKELLHTLVTISVVQSRAFPPTSELDATLKQLLDSPKGAIALLNTGDLDAGYFLSTYLSGYATVRKFYELRDEEILSNSNKPTGDVSQRKSDGASALVASIASAANSIRGGLLDPSTDVIIPVDNLLVLLGEALLFLNQSKPVFSSAQLMIILKVTEDLETINPHVFSRCETTLKAALADAHDSTPSSPQMLKKSISNMTTSSHFSMVGSLMFKSQFTDKSSAAPSSASSSGVLVKGPIKRGWDWRSALPKDTPPDRVLRILRLGLAKDIAKGWVRAG